MAAKRRRQRTTTVKAHKRGGVHVRGYCRRPPTSRMVRKARQDKAMPF